MACLWVEDEQSSDGLEQGKVGIRLVGCAVDIVSLHVVFVCLNHMHQAVASLNAGDGALNVKATLLKVNLL